MKYIKTFELHFISELKIGDYVKVYGDFFDNSLIDFFEINIGRLIKIDDSEYPYIVEFEETLPPIHGGDNKKMGFERDEIIEWSPDKEIIKMKKDINKYNL
jgi:hypothetical protein